MESRISIKFNKLIDAWLQLKKTDNDWYDGLADSSELFDHEWNQHECEKDLLHEIKLQIFRDEVGEDNEPINPFDF